MTNVTSQMFIIAIFAVFGVVVGAPTLTDAQAKIDSEQNTNDGTGNYEFSYITSNGLRRSESGTVINPGQPNQFILVKGVYSYTDPDGNEHIVYYQADDEGYRMETPLAASFSPIDSPAIVASLLG